MTFNCSDCSVAVGPNKSRLSTYLRNRKDEDNVAGRDRRNCRSAINTGRPERMREICLPLQVPSTCRRHFPAAVNNPVEIDGWDVMNPAAFEAGLCPSPGVARVSCLGQQIDRENCAACMLLIFPNNGVYRSQDVLAGHCVEKTHEVVIPFDIVFFTGSCPVSVEGFPQLSVAYFAYLDCRSTVSWQSRSKQWMPSPTVCCTRTVHTRL